MSYAKLSRNCDTVSAALVSNRKFINPLSPLYGLYPINNCPRPIQKVCTFKSTKSCNCSQGKQSIKCIENKGCC